MQVIALTITRKRSCPSGSSPFMRIVSLETGQGYHRPGPRSADSTSDASEREPAQYSIAETTLHAIAKRPPLWNSLRDASQSVTPRDRCPEDRLKRIVLSALAKPAATISR